MQLAGVFMKQTCTYGPPGSGFRGGAARTCDSEPTLLLVVIAALAVVGVIAGMLTYMRGRMSR